MEAVLLEDGVCVIQTERCIGCGLCVTTCTTNALSLQPKAEPPDVPRTNAESALHLGRERGVLKMRDLAAMMGKSKADRLLVAQEREDKL